MFDIRFPQIPEIDWGRGRRDNPPPENMPVKDGPWGQTIVCSSPSGMPEEAKSGKSRREGGSKRKLSFFA